MSYFSARARRIFTYVVLPTSAIGGCVGWLLYQQVLDFEANRRRHLNVYRDIERDKVRRAALGLPPCDDEYVLDYERRKAKGTLLFYGYAKKNGWLEPPPFGK